MTPSMLYMYLKHWVVQLIKPKVIEPGAAINKLWFIHCSPKGHGNRTFTNRSKVVGKIPFVKIIEHVAVNMKRNQHGDLNMEYTYI